MLQVLTVGLHQSFIFRSDQQASVRWVLYDARDDQRGKPTTGCALFEIQLVFKECGLYMILTRTNKRSIVVCARGDGLSF
jgi:hypothetical protein